MKNIKRFSLSKFFYAIGSRGKFFIHRLFAMDLSFVEKKEIINGLKEAGDFELLGSLLIESKDPQIKKTASMALFTMSKLDGFFEFLDSIEIDLLNKDSKEIIDQ